MNKYYIKRFAAMLVSVLALVGLHAVTGCEGGGGSDGSSTIQGNVSRYTGGVATYMPGEHTDRLSTFLSSLGDLFSTPAYAAGLEGVTVTVEGTSLSAVTDGNGHFVISGVPAGDYTLVISYDGQTATYAVNVPSDNATITLGDIEVEHGVVSVANVEIEIEAEDDDSADDSNDDSDNSGSGNDDGDDSDDDSADDSDDDSDNSGSGSNNSGSDDDSEDDSEDDK